MSAHADTGHEHTRIDAGSGDLECLVGMSSSRGTRPSGALWFGVALVMTSALWLLISFFPETRINHVLTRSWTNFASIGFAFWCVLILAMKLVKIRIQRRALAVTGIFPSRSDWVLSPGTAPEVLQRIRARVDRPREFTLFNRVWVALSNLGNIGEARDVGAVLDSQAHADSAKVDAGYTALRVLIWTIPVMGFIGTVIGLGQAIGSFQNVLDATGGESANAIKDRLGPVVSGLATKFDTTLVALLATVVVQLLTTWVYSLEEDFLADVQAYCHEHIVARLKLVDW